MWAQTPTSPDAAHAGAIDHFKEAMDLFQRGEIAPACRTFERSYGEDAAPGTLYNLAICHEAEGRLADAYRELDSLAERAESSGHADKAVGLRARLQALQPRLVRVELVRRADARAEAIAVTVDEAPLLAADWKRPLYLSPAAHRVRIRRADGTEVTKVIAARQPGDAVSLELEEPSGPTPSELASRRLEGYVTGAAGLALVGAASYFGLRTFQQRDAGEALCMPDGQCPSAKAKADAYGDRGDAKTDAALSTVGFIAGGAAVAVGVALVVTGRSPSTTSPAAAAASGPRGWQLFPSSDGHGVSAQLGGTF